MSRNAEVLVGMLATLLPLSHFLFSSSWDFRHGRNKVDPTFALADSTFVALAVVHA